MKERISNILNKEKIKAFCEGPIYPIAIAVITLLGSLTSLEIFFCFLFLGLSYAALICCNTAKPVIINLCAFVYQASVKNSPFFPNYEDYYYSGWRLPVLIFIIISLAGFGLYFIIKNKLYEGISIKKTPLLLPLLILSAALLLNGVFSGIWKANNLVYAGMQILALLLIFLFFYQGLRNEKAEELGSYFAYLSMILAIIISVEVIALYLTSDNIFINGSINKVGVSLGWGIWNLIGISAVVLIPMNFYGMAKNRYPWLYFSVATLIWLTSILSMSRNALIFGTLSYVACVLIFSFVGEKKKVFRIIVLAGLAFAAVFAVIFFDKIYSLFKDFFDRGLSDNGRFGLWKDAYNNFLEAPVFGKGFYGFNSEHGDVFGPWPKSAHNTLLQLLSAGGIVCFLAYLFYRLASILPFIKKPCLLKTMLGISVLALLVGSLLDNFIFNIYPTFYMSIALIIAFKKNEEEGGSMAGKTKFLIAFAVCAVVLFSAIAISMSIIDDEGPDTIVTENGEIDVSDGLDVYVWQMAKGSYSFGLLPHAKEPRDWISKELLSLRSLSAEDVRNILSDAEIDEDRIYIIPWQNPISSYISDYWHVKDGEDTEAKRAAYIENVRNMIFS